ncbi:MAG: ATP-binding cassette domain-containing protein, partial [Patescibacteria group bacterium]|nr:ATP-binding cassette domain-containing protein [Patescibacteria group bacterium]
MPVISVDNLSRTYTFYKKDPGVVGSLSALINRKTEEARAVDTISFSIEEGELVGFLGPNGAGKTTTLKMLSGLIHPTSGRLSVLGYEPRRREKVFQ